MSAHSESEAQTFVGLRLCVIKLQAHVQVDFMLLAEYM